MFLCKIKNTDDRDCVKYLDFREFECGHYFSGINIHGACFSGFEKELRDAVENNFDDVETILTKDEFLRLFELDDELDKLGNGIEKDDDRYNKGMKIIEEYHNTIEQKLLSDDNEELFNKVIADEKEYIKDKYDLNDEDVETIFDNYNGDYQDRAIVGYVYDDVNDLVENEKWNYGYQDIKYFDDDAFASDLLEDDMYLELDSGRIVYYSY